MYFYDDNWYSFNFSTIEINPWCTRHSMSYICKCKQWERTRFSRHITINQRKAVVSETLSMLVKIVTKNNFMTLFSDKYDFVAVNVDKITEHVKINYIAK